MDGDELMSRLEQGARRYRCEGREEKEGRWAIATIAEDDPNRGTADAMTTGMRTGQAGVDDRLDTREDACEPPADLG